MSNVLVVYSGGLDSYTLLRKAIKKFDRVEAITFNYGQKHSKEIEFAKLNCKELNVKHEVVNLELEKILSNSALVGDTEIPEGNYDKEKMKQNILLQYYLIHKAFLFLNLSNILNKNIFYIFYKLIKI